MISKMNINKIINNLEIIQVVYNIKVAYIDEFDMYCRWNIDTEFQCLKEIHHYHNIFYLPINKTDGHIYSFVCIFSPSK